MYRENQRKIKAEMGTCKEVWDRVVMWKAGVEAQSSCVLKKVTGST